MQLDRTDHIVGRLKELQGGIRNAIIRRRAQMPVERLAQIVQACESDVKYEVDLAAEEQVIDFCRTWAAEEGVCFVLVAEGVSSAGGRVERMTFPESADESRASFVLIVDPCDGTRSLMYDKRSAWVLSGVAPFKPSGNTLADITVAVQTELPTSKQSLADTLYATSGGKAVCERIDLASGKTVSRFNPAPSSARTLDQGFATVSKFFPGGKQMASHIEEALALRLMGPIQKSRPAIFDDEYISTGGQLYELACGHDRFIADIRPLTANWLRRKGLGGGLCAHPYDVCTELIARQAGACIAQPDGSPLAAPLDAITDVAWVGYANRAIRELVEPHFQELLASYLVHNGGAEPSGEGPLPLGLPRCND